MTPRSSGWGFETTSVTIDILPSQAEKDDSKFGAHLIISHVTRVVARRPEP